MKKFRAIFNHAKLKALILALMFLAAGNIERIYAHGGEDHGDAKPKTETTDKGTVSHSSRLGDLEVMLKHPLFKPDTATDGRLFVTKFETNEAFKDVVPTVEIEAANGSVTQGTIEKSETAGIFSVKFPALPEGIYTIRTKLTHDGETDTATFSGVEIKNQTLTATENGGMSWLRTVLIGFIFLTILGLFGALSYFVLRLSSAGESANQETVSA